METRESKVSLALCNLKTYVEMLVATGRGHDGLTDTYFYDLGQAAGGIEAALNTLRSKIRMGTLSGDELREVERELWQMLKGGTLQLLTEPSRGQLKLRIDEVRALLNC